MNQLKELLSIIEESKISAVKTHKLVSANGGEIKIGDTVKTVDGANAKVLGWYKIARSENARVSTDKGDFYPAVLNAKIVPVSEDSVKMKILDMILANAKKIDRKHMNDDKVAEKILKLVRAQDRAGISKGMSDEALKNLIKLNSQETLESVVAEADDAQEDSEPVTLAKSGDFQLILFPNTEQVQLQNRAGKVFVQMPFIIWKGLARQ